MSTISISGGIKYLCTMELFKFRDDWIISSQTLLGMWLLFYAGIKVNQEVGVPAGKFCISFLCNILSRAREGLMMHKAKALAHPNRKKITDILQTTFSKAFLAWKQCFYSNFIWIVPRESKDNQTLVPKVVLCHYVNQCWTASLQ